jgi:hypothetical protein
VQPGAKRACCPHTRTTASAAQLLNGISDGNRDGNTGTRRLQMVLALGGPTASRAVTLTILRTDLLTTALDGLERERNEQPCWRGRTSYYAAVDPESQHRGLMATAAKARPTGVFGPTTVCRTRRVGCSGQGSVTNYAGLSQAVLNTQTGSGCSQAYGIR